jgi:hypothetical protein
VVVQLDLGVAPILLVALVADGEVELPAAGFDCMLQQSMQVHDAGSEARGFAIVMARQQMIVAAAIHQPEIGGCRNAANVQAADMDEAARPRTGGEIEQKVLMPGRREDIAHAHAAEGAGFLLEQRVQGARNLIAILGAEEADLSVLGKALALGAIAPAGR